MRLHVAAWRRLLTDLWREASAEFGGSLASKLGARLTNHRVAKAITEADLPSDPDLPAWEHDTWSSRFAKKAQKLAARKARQIADATKRALERATKAAQKAGEAFSAAVADAYRKFDQVRSWFISEEETLQAAATAEEEAAEAAPLEITKTWISQRDDRVRASHAKVDGEKIPSGGRYSNGLRFPKDPEGPMHEVAGCRCYQVFGYRLPTAA